MKQTTKQKKSKKRGVPPVESSCGSQGCSVAYIMPHAGTSQDFNRHTQEGFKVFKQAA